MSGRLWELSSKDHISHGSDILYKVYNLLRFNNNASVICPALNLPESDFAIVSIGILSDLGSELWVSSDSLHLTARCGLRLSVHLGSVPGVG